MKISSFSRFLDSKSYPYTYEFFSVYGFSWKIHTCMDYSQTSVHVQIILKNRYMYRVFSKIHTNSLERNIPLLWWQNTNIAWNRLMLQTDVTLLLVHTCMQHPFDQCGTRSMRKKYQHHFSGWCFWPCFHCIWQIFVLTSQWRLLTGWYVIMASRFITCSYVVEKHVHSFQKRARFFSQVAMFAAHCLCSQRRLSINLRFK